MTKTFESMTGVAYGAKAPRDGSGIRTLVAGVAAAGLMALAPLSVQAQETHLVTVVGLGGGPEYTQTFFGWGASITNAARDRYGIPEANSILLTEDDGDPAPSSGEARREAVQAAIRDVARRAGPQDRVLIVLIGHGSFREDEARFNIPGPDLTAAEWSSLLNELAGRQVALVNAASASGPFVQMLAGPDRTVISATKTGRQRNETVFGQYFVQAFEGDAADLDKDGGMSLLEAFTYATSEVARHYTEGNLLQVENAVLDDNGDGVGSEEPAIDGEDGARAASFIFLPVQTLELTPEMQADSVLVRLMGERSALERQIAQLRSRRAEIDPETYDLQLEELLIELALKNREVDVRRGGGGG